LPPKVKLTSGLGWLWRSTSDFGGTKPNSKGLSESVSGFEFVFISCCVVDCEFDCKFGWAFNCGSGCWFCWQFNWEFELDWVFVSLVSVFWPLVGLFWVGDCWPAADG